MNLPEPRLARPPQGRVTTWVTWSGAALAVAGCYVAWEYLLPAVWQTTSVAFSLGALSVGFLASCFSFGVLLDEGRADPKSVPVLAVRLSLALAFTGWITFFVLGRSVLAPWSENVWVLVGALILVGLYLATLLMGGKVDQVAAAEAEKLENLTRIRAKASRLLADLQLEGSASAREKAARVVDELRYLSPAEGTAAWETEMEILQALTDLPGSPASEQEKHFDRLLSLISNRRKFLN
ncbi:MAG: hypothetical protein WCG80_02965 [Spirochaetales bacterium]